VVSAYIILGVLDRRGIMIYVQNMLSQVEYSCVEVVSSILRKILFNNLGTIR